MRENAVTQAAFARMAGVSREAISKGVAELRLDATPLGRVRMDSETNLEYIVEHLSEQVFQIRDSGELLPGWAALSAAVGDRLVPLQLFPPYPVDDTPLLTKEAAEFDFNNDSLEKTGTAKGIDGKSYQLVFITHPAVKPPWRKAAEKADKGKAAARG